MFFSPSLLALVRAVHGFAGVLIGCCRVLIRGGRAFLRRTDAALRLLVNLFHLVASVFDLLTVTARLLAYLIHFRLNGSSGICTYFFVAHPPASKAPVTMQVVARKAFISLKPRM